MLNPHLFSGVPSLIKKSMQDSAVQVRRSLGRTSYATTHSEALQQAKMLERSYSTNLLLPTSSMRWRRCRV